MHESEPVTASNDLSDVEEKYIQQPLDHFSMRSNSFKSKLVNTLNQRFFYSSRYVSSFNASPSFAFLCVGGEGPSLTKNVLLDSVHCTGDMLELAKRLYEDGFSVHLFALEHRYYGKSYPDFVNPVSNENLIYLSSKQALADLAHFITIKNAELSTKTQQTTDNSSSDSIKWITFGGSYPGMLAAWARLKYPHLVYASVSNSSPVQAQLDFPEYYNHVSYALSDEKIGGSDECFKIVSEGHAQVVDAFNKADQGELDELEDIVTLFNVCDGIDGLKNKLDRNIFVGDGLISLYVQGNDPSCTEDLCNVEKICHNIIEKNENKTSIERLAELHHDQSTSQNCLKPSWDDMLNFLSSPMSRYQGTRSWIWQTCTEFGFYQTCEVGSNCPYGKGFHTIDQDLEICEKAFGIDKNLVSSNVLASLEYYGGWNLKSSRILFVNGDVDPWSMLSVTGTHGSADVPTISVKGASHHFWTHKLKSSDSSEVSIAREKIYYQVKTWLDIQEDELDYITTI